METTWDLIKSLYVEMYNMPEYVVDHLAVYDILFSCCQGYSNKTLALKFDFDEAYVRETLKEFLKFEGFAEDLSFNPRAIYERYRYNWYVFTINVRQIDKSLSDELCKKLYKMNVEIDKIKKGIDSYYV